MGNKERKVPSGKFMSTVKVGPKGQIVIPKEARDMFGIEPGDNILFLADEKQGMAMQKMDVVSKIVTAIFARNKAGEQLEENELAFAEEVEGLNEETPEP